MFRKILVASTLTFGLLAGQAASAADSRPLVTLDMAKRMIAACEDLAAKEGWRMNIAVVDRGADLIAFHRMNDASLGSVGIAINKAKTSANFPFSTRVVEQIGYGKDGEPPRVPGIVQVEGIIAFAGGLPIKVGDHHVGGIGVSGASADQDEVCAQAGLDAVAADLK